MLRIHPCSTGGHEKSDDSSTAVEPHRMAPPMDTRQVHSRASPVGLKIARLGKAVGMLRLSLVHSPFRWHVAEYQSSSRSRPSSRSPRNLATNPSVCPAASKKNPTTSPRLLMPLIVVVPTPSGSSTDWKCPSSKMNP